MEFGGVAIAAVAGGVLSGLFVIIPVVMMNLAARMTTPFQFLIDSYIEEDQRACAIRLAL